MPRNKFQTIIFTLLTTLFMVYVMICYNIAIDTGSMQNQVFLLALKELVIMWPAAFLLERLIGEKLAMKLAARIIIPEMKVPIVMILVISSMTVCVMCPLMSLLAVLLFRSPGIELFPVWIKTIVLNFPMAFFSQIFFIGPFVRLIFGLIFRKDTVDVRN